MLLAESITLLSDPKQSLGEALYKTKVLFHQLGRKDLVPWVTHESPAIQTNAKCHLTV